MWDKLDHIARSDVTQEWHFQVDISFIVIILILEGQSWTKQEKYFFRCFIYGPIDIYLQYCM